MRVFDRLYWLFLLLMTLGLGIASAATDDAGYAVVGGLSGVLLIADLCWACDHVWPRGVT